jgi:hypothetical protein
MNTSERTKKVFLSIKSTAIAFSLIIVLSCTLIWMHILAAYGVDVVRMDQWDTPARQILLYQNGNLTLSDLAAQHNEGRKIFPNLVSIGMVLAKGHFDTQAELFIGFGIAVAITVLVCALGWLSFRRVEPMAVIVALFSGLLWSSHTADFHLFSITFERLLPELALLAIVSGFLWRKFTWFAVTVAATGCIVSQYSFPGGIVLWGLVIIFPILAYPCEWKDYLSKIMAVLIIATASTAFYLCDYSRPAHHSPLSAVLDQPVEKIFLFVFEFLGNAVASAGVAAALLGCILLILFAAMFLRFLKKPPSADERPVYAAWFVLGGYSLAQGLLATIGRLPMGLKHATRPDYITHPFYMVIALAAIGLLMAKGRKPHFVYFGVIAVTTVLILSLAQPAFWHKLRIHKQTFAYAKACLLLSRHYVDERCLDILYPASESRMCLFASRDSILHPAILENLAVTEPGRGYVETLNVFGSRLRARGWAAQRQEPADAVVAAIQTPSGLKVLGVAQVHEERKDVARLVHRNLLLSGWSMNVSAAREDVQTCNVRIFSFDTSTGTLAPLTSAWEQDSGRVRP